MTDQRAETTISMVIPLYNKARHIGRALNSVLAQAHQDFEIIVVNDGSTDGSDEVVHKFTDPRIRLISQDNAGVGTTRNRGIAEASGDLIAFLDADDEWLPHFLQTILHLRERFPDCGAYATAYDTITAEERRLHFRNRDIPSGDWEGIIQNYFHTAPIGQPVWSSAVAIPKSTFAACGNFDESRNFGEDLDMWARIALKFPIAFSASVSAIYHKEADNSNRFYLLREPFSELTKTLDAALQAGGFHETVSLADLKEYLNVMLIYRASCYIYQSQNSKGREMLRLANSTIRFRRKWRTVHLLSFLPGSLIRAALKLKDRIGVSLMPK